MMKGVSPNVLVHRYEIMQSCWLPPSQRPSVAEIFILLSSLLAAERGVARGSVGEEDEEDEEYEESRGRRGESEESFERRWDLLRPPAFHTAANERHRDRENSIEDRDNSYPLLDPVGNCITPTSSELDDILTVTETSKGLNFEYFWEKAHARRGYKPLPPPQPIPTVNNNHRQSLDTPTVVPVISARSPSLASEYYIRLEEHTPQDKSPTLKGKTQSSFRPDSVCPGDMELVEIRSGMLGKERVPYCSSDKCRKTLQTVRSSEVQLQVPNTGVAEFRDTSSRVTDFSVVDLGDDDEVEKKKSSGPDKKSSTTSQAPVLPPKPRSMSMSSYNHLHSRPLPAPPLGYRGLPHYTKSGKIETDPLHMSTCPPSTFDHLGLHRSHQTLPPSPSLSPSIPPSSHPIYPQPPQMCPPPLPPHSNPQRSVPSYNTAEVYSRYSKPQMQRSNRDPLSCDMSDRESDTGYGASIHSSKETSRSRVKDFDSPIRRENPLRPIYQNPPRPQAVNPPLDRQSSSSPTYSDEDDSPYMSPERPSSETGVVNSSLSEDTDSSTTEFFSRGMKRTQSRLDTILPAIWREDAELQAERIAAARKSPMHLFLTEISSVTESSDVKSESSWDGEKEEKKDGERWGPFLLPTKGMRRSQSLITELGSTGQSWEQDKHVNRTAAEEDKAAMKESFQKDLFLTEIDTGRMDSETVRVLETDSVKYLYPAGSRSRLYVCSSDLPSYKEAEEAYSKGIRRSRSLLSEISVEKQGSETPLTEDSQRPEMTREEFLKEIQSAETFLTEIISRQNAAANRKEPDPSYSPTPLSPEYESICIDPNSTQTIRFQSESSIRASNKGKDDTQTEAIYAQVTKRAKKSEIKVSIRPEIPILHIGSNKQPFKLESAGTNADHCQSGEFVFSEVMPKNGLLHKQALESQKEEEECTEGPALPARGEQADVSELSPSESTQPGAESNTVISSENKSLVTDETEKAAVIGNGEVTKDSAEACSPEKGDRSEGKSDMPHNAEKRADSKNSKNASSYDNNSFVDANGEHYFGHNDTGQETLCHITQTEPSLTAAPTTPEWDPSSDGSLVTPTDSVLSPMTSSSADCLTPSDSWPGVGGGTGSSGWRTQGNDMPHRDSAYFSDSDWESDGMNRRSSDGLISSRPSSGRGSERATLTGIEERTEEEGETREKSPLRNSLHVSVNETVTEERRTVEIYERNEEMCQNIAEKDISHLDKDKDILNKSLDSEQRDDSGIFSNESKKSALLFGDPEVKDCVDLIDKLFSKLDDEPLKRFLHSSEYVIDSPFTDGIISKITDHQYQDSEESGLNLHSKSHAETSSLIKSISGIQSKDCVFKTSNKDYTSVTETHNDLNDLKSLKSGNETFDSISPSQSDSRLSAQCDIPISDGIQRDETLPKRDGEPFGEKVDNLTSPGLDQNKLGLRSLECLDGKEDKEVVMETEKQQATAELRDDLKEKTPVSREMSTIDSANNMCNSSCDLWSPLGKDEERPGSEVVQGELDCHRLSKSPDLSLWPDENDQWASPERRCQDVELRSEFFSGFGNKAWEVGERLVVGQEYWETEENDELAGSEPHPAVLEGCEETWINETQGLMWNSNSTDDQQTAAEIQQEENIETLEVIESFKNNTKPETSDIDQENTENPVEETLVQGEKEISSFSKEVRVKDSPTDTEENQNFNIWPQNQFCNFNNEGQTSAVRPDTAADFHFENHFSHTLENKSPNISEVNFPDLENDESGFNSEAERRPWLAQQYIEDKREFTKVEEDYKDILLQSNLTHYEAQEEKGQSYPEVDNFSSVDFPSPPPSIDLDVQDDKLESLDDSFPSPPPSVIEAEDFLSHINLDNFIGTTETDLYISPSNSTNVSEPPLQELQPAATQNKGISANLNSPTVHITLTDESNLTTSLETPDDHTDISQKTSPAVPSASQDSLKHIPELLISEWKDLDEEPLEDFEKLEQLCCISEDEEETLGELFLGNLELLDSLKKTSDQKDSSTSDEDANDKIYVSTPPEGGSMDLKEDRVSDYSDGLVELDQPMILDSQGSLSPPVERSDWQKPAGQTCDVKDQGSFSKMTTKNGLMMQVSVFPCELLLA